MLKVFNKFYLQAKLSPGITALYSNIIIDQISSGLVGIFMPIILLLGYLSDLLCCCYFWCKNNVSHWTKSINDTSHSI